MRLKQSRSDAKTGSPAANQAVNIWWRHARQTASTSAWMEDVLARLSTTSAAEIDKLLPHL